MTKQITGLTDKEVEARLQRGLDNHTSRRTSRSLLSILRGNILTPFNALITALAAAIWLVGSSPINSLFFIAMLLNIVVGIVQEIKAKIVLDRLSIMVKPVAKVVRNGKHRRIGSEDVVQDEKAGAVVVDKLLERFLGMPGVVNSNHTRFTFLPNEV